VQRVVLALQQADGGDADLHMLGDRPLVEGVGRELSLKRGDAFVSAA
jgi:hypothetical protein